jgi:hypothetical protein
LICGGLGHRLTRAELTGIRGCWPCGGGAPCGN